VHLLSEILIQPLIFSHLDLFQLPSLWPGTQAEFNGDVFLRVKAMKYTMEINLSQILLPNMFSLGKFDLGEAMEPTVVA